MNAMKVKIRNHFNTHFFIFYFIFIAFQYPFQVASLAKDRQYILKTYHPMCVLTFVVLSNK